ncbi:hypothetical protein A2239_04380 [Candidatus Uhrbacteria bacterium RIFOXYA2_FULL_40_9]|nr:MAG: hypothetical protein UT94_C0002G0028 [Candidatus Uhrbacteria bacterium GW2011_GWF2_40_263]OGL92987.1 MAG: hypothetical protein A2239_04380 [Candidatus Uhrbacteria bacterium RIFOXYA2_FULL_40_9]OGL97387.1 MAG: hypothetical protein A2332_04685 [Candidatus Uhrbacteria bacterium RIFOXYB2_FULL_41_18]HBK35023.1 cytidyltransferase [Candidatus Uhrbacteria bacterium]HCB56176.1 cytidyltransferase [Candidatus Uhrbacteria bacterium]
METTQERKNSTPFLTTGLVLGKFAPLHKGHQLLIETACAQCDEVFVLIYDSREVISIPLHIRADWIRHLYPEVIVIEGWDGPLESGDTPKIKAFQEEYIKRVLPKPVTHFFSSEWYGEHVSHALGAKNILVDQKRLTVPISGTLIRNKPHQYKTFLDPYVYKDFMKKIVFLGAESTGKSTIVRALAEKYQTEAVMEYGREYWDAHHDENGQLSLEQLVELAKVHRAREDRACLSAQQYVFIDTNAITTRYYSQLYHGSVHPVLDRLARLCFSRYDACFVCDTDIPFEQDGTRRDEQHRNSMQQTLIKDLTERGISFDLLSGSLEERVIQVKYILSKM